MTAKWLANYDIIEKIGVGGMGEVFCARDTKLQRDLALKILPEAFARDNERLGPFECEAKLRALLNHPNIASILILEQSDSKRFLVLERIG